MSHSTGVESQWGTATDTASTLVASSEVRGVFYQTTVQVVQSVLNGIVTAVPGDLSAVNASSRGDVMRIPFTVGTAEISVEYLMNIERQLARLSASVAARPGTGEIVVTINPNRALETAARMKRASLMSASRPGGWTLLFMIILVCMALVVYFSIPASTKIALVRAYVPKAEPFFQRLGDIFAGAARVAGVGGLGGKPQNGST